MQRVREWLLREWLRPVPEPTLHSVEVTMTITYVSPPPFDWQALCPEDVAPHPGVPVVGEGRGVPFDPVDHHHPSALLSRKEYRRAKAQSVH